MKLRGAKIVKLFIENRTVHTSLFDRQRQQPSRARVLKDRSPERKMKWLKTHCTHCGTLVEYASKEYFRGALYCGNCGKAFKLTRLDDFVEEARDEEKV
jgi:hypothetical protein